MNLAYFPWHVLVGVCLLGFLFLALFLWSDKQLEATRVNRDLLRRTADGALGALEECEYELAAERMRADELREELHARDRDVEVLRRQVERTANPLLRGTQTTHRAVHDHTAGGRE